MTENEWVFVWIDQKEKVERKGDCERWESERGIWIKEREREVNRKTERRRKRKSERDRVCGRERDREGVRESESIWYSFKILTTTRWSQTIEKVGNTSLC